MRDYYSEYIGKKLQYPSRTEGTKGAEGCISAGSTPSAPFAPSVSYEIPEISGAGSQQWGGDGVPSAPFDPSVSCDIPEIFKAQFAHLDAASRQQLSFEIEERVAIMMFDGGSPEPEATAAAAADVLRRWFGGSM
jgi:hypothetical protein